MRPRDERTTVPYPVGGSVCVPEVFSTMEMFGVLVLGLAAGWAARAGVDSKREAAVKVIAAAYALRDRTLRRVAVERENIEDLFAEAKAAYEGRRARRTNGAVPMRPEGSAKATDRAA